MSARTDVGAETPSDYLNVRGAVLSHVAATSPTMPVGLLRCQNDPLCKELTTVVHSAKRASVAGASSGSKVKNGGGASGKTNDKQAKDSPVSSITEDTGELWHVLLQDTIIFPEGGGQPSDTGTLQLFESFEGSQPAELSIVSAFRRNLDAVHMVHIPSGVPAQNLLQRGAKVLVKVDWQRREDHMQQHTGQHLLSAYLDSLDPPLPTLSWGLAAWPQPCYVELPRAPTDAELESVRAQLSASIKRGHSITVTVESMEQVAHAPPKLPQDYVAGADGAGDDVNSQGVIRTVNIDGIDANPCCGTHWPSLRFLHYIHIYPGTSKIRGSNVRLYFDVGRRAFHNLLESFDVAASISRTLGCARGETTARLDMLMAKEKGARKRELQLKEEVALSLAEAVVQSALSPLAMDHNSTSGPLARLQRRKAELDCMYTLQAYQQHTAIDDGSAPRMCAITLHRADADLELLSAVAREVESVYRQARTADGLPTLLLCLSSGATVPAAPLVIGSRTESLLLVAFETPSAAPVPEAGAPGGGGKKAGTRQAPSAAERLVSKAAEQLRSTFGDRLKGGGNGRWQGKLSPSPSSSSTKAPVAEPRWEKEDARRRMEALKHALQGVA